MASARQGDADAFAEIYDRHASAALALADRILRSRTEAQDLLQDVFLEAWEHVREYDASRAGVRTWLFVRMRSRALDRLGRATRRDAGARSVSARAADATQVPAERGLAVRQALAALDVDVRAALEASYFEGMTANEIAERVGIPVGTVKSRLARGLATLERVLDDVGGDT
jgi:RNA polymerase sigma-70 factor (ECF subfamily)